jgi:hypothetical protein
MCSGGFLSVAMKHAASRHPDWLRVTHEQLIADPVREFSRLFNELDLRWTQEAEALIMDSDRPGRGFETLRVRSELKDSWRRRLTSAHAADVEAVLASFPSR